MLIFVPQGAEYQAVCRGLRRVAQPPQVVPIPVGVQPVTRFLQRTFSLQSSVLVMGLCGSLTDRLRVGDVVIYDDCVDFSGTVWKCEPRFLKEAISVRALTSDRILTSASEKRSLGKIYQADVVDMEGSAILTVFAEAGISVSMVRVVSDDSHHDLPELQGAIDSEGKLRSLPLALGMLRQPIAATRLIRGSLKGLQILEQICRDVI